MLCCVLVLWVVGGGGGERWKIVVGDCVGFGFVGDGGWWSGWCGIYRQGVTGRTKATPTKAQSIYTHAPVVVHGRHLLVHVNGLVPRELLRPVHPLPAAGPGEMEAREIRVAVVVVVLLGC